MSVIEKIKEQIERKRQESRKRRIAIRKGLPKLAPLFAEVEALGGEPYTDGDWIFVPVCGDKIKFLAFARCIAKHGFKTPKVEKGATGFTQLEYMGDGDDMVPVYFQFSSTACRRVKVGTKTVEQDVYETVCDELMPYGEAPAPASTATAEDSIPF